jgi:cytochrome P450
MQSIPENYAKKMSLAINRWMDYVIRTREYVIRVNKQFKAGIKPKRRTIFHKLLNPLSTNDKTYCLLSFERLYGEALSFCTATADITGNTMEMAAYYVVTNPDIYDKLKKELRDTFPDLSTNLDYITLEKLPYFTSVMKEGQRLSYDVISRLARVTPEGGATFYRYFVPAGIRLLL